MGLASGDWAARAVGAARDAIITVDAAGSVVEANPSAETLFGHSRAEIVGRPVSELIPVPPIRPPVPRQAVAPMPGRARRRDGEELPVELVVIQSGDEPLLATAFVRQAVVVRAEPPAARMERLLTAAQELAQIGSWELDLRTGETVWSEGLYRILGLEPAQEAHSQDAIVQWIHPNDRQRLDDMLTDVSEHPEVVPDGGLSTEFRIVRPDGATREIEAHGTVQHDDAGRPARWVGILQDVTAERLTEHELQAHYAVSEALRQWETFEEGIMDLLRRVGTALRYDMGTVWRWDDDEQALVCRAFWHAPDVDPAGFDLAKRTLRFRAGEGKPGLAWERQEPVVTPDAANDPVFQPRLAAVRRGVESGLAFPALASDGPIAVLSYYSFEHRVPSPSLVRTLTGMGRELGRFLARRRAQLGPQSLSAREVEVLALAADGASGPAIADHLVLSPSTVKTHFENIYEKLGVSDRAAAVAMALRMGLIT
jgi:PAS domain S-box-containing protein